MDFDEIHPTTARVLIWLSEHHGTKSALYQEVADGVGISVQDVREAAIDIKDNGWGESRSRQPSGLPCIALNGSGLVAARDAKRDAERRQAYRVEVASEADQQASRDRTNRFHMYGTWVAAIAAVVAVVISLVALSRANRALDMQAPPATQATP